MTRKTVLYSGRVQGVGFRMTTRMIAQRHAVTGFVRNLADGRVEVVAEGAPEEVDRFLNEIQGHMRAFVREAVVQTSPASGEFEEFSITH